MPETMTERLFGYTEFTLSVAVMDLYNERRQAGDNHEQAAAAVLHEVNSALDYLKGVTPDAEIK